jgi:hypothetical protein
MEKEQKTKGKNNELKEERPEIKSFKFYWFTPFGTPKQIAKNGLIIMLVGGIAMVIFKGSLLGDLFSLMGFYGQLLLLIALIKWIKNKIQKKKVLDNEKKH